MSMPATSPPDVELVELARQGDRPAFDDLLRRHDARMRGLAYRLLADRDAMDGVLQTAYLEAHRSLDRLRPGRDVGTWLYRLTYNACVDELRRGKRHAAERGARPASGLGPSEAVRAALADLPVDQRVTVVLVDGEGFDHREVAEILGTAPGTVAFRLSRARARLRRVLGEEIR